MSHVRSASRGVHGIRIQLAGVPCPSGPGSRVYVT